MLRGVELFLTLTAATALLPVMLVIAAINSVATGRVVFRQVRLGRALRPFAVFKFQTMVDGAERGSSVTVSGDRRVTPLGRILRASKLDELPQLFNVLRGEMSLVGPRALTPGEVARIAPDVAAYVYSVRPGLTGLGTLMLTDEERVLARMPDPESYYFDVILPRKMAWESLYVRRRSVWMDALILAATPLAVVFPRLARNAVIRLFGGASERHPSLTGEERA